MSAREFLPNSKYQYKMMLVITLIGFLVLVGMGIISGLIALDDPGAVLPSSVISSTAGSSTSVPSTSRLPA